MSDQPTQEEILTSYTKGIHNPAGYTVRELVAFGVEVTRCTDCPESPGGGRRACNGLRLAPPRTEPPAPKYYGWQGFGG